MYSNFFSLRNIVNGVLVRFSSAPYTHSRLATLCRRHKGLFFICFFLYFLSGLHVDDNITERYTQKNNKQRGVVWYFTCAYGGSCKGREQQHPLLLLLPRTDRTLLRIMFPYIVIYETREWKTRDSRFVFGFFFPSTFLYMFQNAFRAKVGRFFFFSLIAARLAVLTNWKLTFRRKNGISSWILQIISFHRFRSACVKIPTGRIITLLLLCVLFC